MDVFRTSWVILARGFLGKVMVFLVSTARILAVTDVGFAVRFIILTTPATTMSALLAQNAVLLLVILATTLGFPFTDSRCRTGGVVTGAASVSHRHPVGGGRNQREGSHRDLNILHSGDHICARGRMAVGGFYGLSSLAFVPLQLQSIDLFTRTLRTDTTPSVGLELG